MLERVLRIQKRAVCIRTTGTLTMFNELNWIPFFIGTYVEIFYPYKRLEGTTPDYINSISKTNSEIHDSSTRFLNLNFHCPSFKKNTEGGRTFSMRTIRN